MDIVIRRQLPNYKLPSECKDILSFLVGKTILRFETGLLSVSVDDFLEKEGLTLEDDLQAIPHGGPLFLSVQKGETIAFNYDDFLRSLVMRRTGANLEDRGFLERLYMGDDYVPYFLKAQQLFDLRAYCNCVMRDIENISIYKYPNNYLGKPIGYDTINETAIGITLSEGGEFLIMSGLGKKYSALGVAVVSWDDVKEERKKDLMCVWRAV